MPITEISQLDKTGVITDINEYLLAPGAFSEAYNVEFANGSMHSAKGFLHYDPKILPEEDQWRYCKGVGDKMYLFSDKKVYITTQYGYEEIAYPNNFMISREFYVNPLSNLPIIVGNNTPFGVRSVEDEHEIFKLDGWGNNMRARNVVSYKGYLFGFGMEIGGVRYEDTLFWSDQAAPDTYPTDWGFELDSAGNIDLTKPVEHSKGGYNQLSAIGGSLTAAEVFGDSLYVFTETEIFKITEIGGPFIFRFEKVSTGKGAVSPSAISPLENGLVVIGFNELYIFDGRSARTLSEGRISKWLSEKLIKGVDIKIVRDFNQQHLYIFFRDKYKTEDSSEKLLYIWDEEGERPDWVDDYIWYEDYNEDNTYKEALVWDWVSNTFSFRDSNYCSFQDITEFRADSLFSGNTPRWEDLDIPWAGYKESWQGEIRFGTGLLAMRQLHTFILNYGDTYLPYEGSELEPVSWSVKRTYSNRVFGYPENSIIRILKIKLKGSTLSNVQVSVNSKLTNFRKETAYLRETGKEFEVNIFGSGFVEIPAFDIEHSLVGHR